MAEPIRLHDVLRNAGLALVNRVRLLKRPDLGYVVLPVGGSYPERTPELPRRPFPLSLLPWPSPPTSVEAFAETLDRLAGDCRVRGVLLIFAALSTGPATTASLRQALLRFRGSGKRVLAYVHDLSTWPYYLASACDAILAPESASFRSAGLRIETLFLKDTLALAGIEADFEAIGEYKVSPDTFRRAEMTEPHREMLESVLDSLYAEIISAIADGRGLPQDSVRELLDSVPLTADQAFDAGLLDGVCYEDELPVRLGTPEAPAPLLPWDRVRRRLLSPLRWQSRRAVGVISVEGLIVPGPSRRSPIPIPLPLPLLSAQVGSTTLVQQLRAAAKDKRLAAIVLHVDSPGGSALASDLIWREVRELRKAKPVVVYMGNRAASGGYYVSAPANAIVAQPVSLTGSIGIWGGKFVTERLFGMAHARRQIVSRGKAAGLYADSEPFNEEERVKIRADIGAGYVRFRGRVAEGRGVTQEQVEAIARGRVWTGEQAVACGLVDTLGDLRTAADRARDLAGLDPRRHSAPTNIPVPRRYIVPTPIQTGAEGWLVGLAGLLREGVFALAPWEIWIRR